MWFEQYDGLGIRRKKKGTAERYAKRAYKCPLCGYGHSSQYSDKAKAHDEECPSLWIFEDWQPQDLQALKFIKSWVSQGGEFRISNIDYVV